MLVSLGLLTGVTSFPPIAASISQDIHLTDVTYGLLGMLLVGAGMAMAMPSTTAATGAPPSVS